MLFAGCSRRLLLLLCLCALISGWAAPMASPHSQPVLLQATDSGRYLNEQLAIYIDESNQKTLQQVVDSGAFVPGQGVSGLGLLSHPVWLRLTLRAEDAPVRWWLELSPFSVAEARFYAPNALGHYRELAAGDDFPFSQRAFPYRQYLYPLALQTKQPVTVYLKIRSHNTTVISLRAWHFEHWAGRSMLEYLLLGACFGAMLALAIYNLLLYVRLKDRLFLLYFLLVSSYVLFAADLNGLAAQLLWPDQGLLPGRNQALVSLFGLLGVLFPLWLLDTPTLGRWYARTLYVMAALYALSILAALVGWLQFAGWVIQRAPLLWFPLVLGVALHRAYRGFKPALYYLVGYAPVFMGLALLIMLGHNAAAADSFNQSFFIVAGVWEALLFSQALAERVSMLRREKDRAMQLAVEEKAARLAIADQHESELEARVRARTEELQRESARHQETAEQLRISERQLMQMAYYDALTGLPNRRLFLDRFEQLAASAKRQQVQFALALIDFDRFKQINDRLGHDAGDAVLVEVAQRLRGLIRETDTVARLGGDEFAMLLASTGDQAGLATLCHRIRQSFNLPILFHGKTLHCTSSIGIAWFGSHGEAFSELYKAADIALYRVKQAGGNDFLVYGTHSQQGHADGSGI